MNDACEFEEDEGNYGQNMLGVGDYFPYFDLNSVKPGKNNSPEDSFERVTNETYKDKWLVVFFWPKDFTFVCPTEIAEFAKKSNDFADRDTQVLGVSVDSEFVHLAWKQHNDKLKDLAIPMLSDIKRELSAELGIIDQEAGVSQRAAYIVDNEGVIRFVMVTDLKVGRNVDEIIRVLDALQTDELCPCNWKKGENTL